MKSIFRLIKRVFILILVLCIVGGFTAAYAFFVEPNQLKTETVSINSDNIGENIKIAVFADTHFGAGYTINNFNKVIDEINKADVDFVLFAGDLIDNFNTYQGDVAEISSKLREIKAKRGKYAVFGNHDYGGGAQNYYKGIMESGGFNVLVNQSVNFNSLNFRITGVDDFLIGYGNKEIVNNLSKDKFNFILCHEPDVFDSFNKEKVDAMVAGHSHGGQVNIPILRDKIGTNLGSKYIKGKYVENDSMLYVNPGVGTTKVKARLFSKPEVTFFEIN